MNSIVKVIVVLGILFSMNLRSQNGIGIQNANHSTIAKVKFNYKGVEQGTININNGLPQPIQGIPQGTITLKPNTNVAKIYLKLISIQSNSIIYEANYFTNSSIITNNLGKKLFENNSGSIFISNGEGLTLRPYKYEIQTEDNAGNLSAIYSVIQ